MKEKYEIGLLPQEKGPWTIYSYASAFLLLIIVTMTFFIAKNIILTAHDEPLVVIAYTGGLCSDGQVCSQSNTIYTNGVSDNGTINLTEDDVTQLNSLIVSSDLSNLTPATNPDCPSFYDGQDVSYVFPEHYSNNIFTPCLIDDTKASELFEYLDVLQQQ